MGDTPYEDSYERMERESTLTKEELAKVKDFMERSAKSRAAFGGKLREIEANPAMSVKYAITINMHMEGEFLKRFLWLDHFLVQTGVFTRGELMQMVITCGIQDVYQGEQSKMVQAMMRESVLAQMPTEVQHAAAVRAAKGLLSILKETEEKAFKESMEAEPPDDNNKGG